MTITKEKTEVDVFEIKATKCIRCGRLLTSDFGLKNGMGPCCKDRFDKENAPPDPNQMTLFEDENPHMAR